MILAHPVTFTPPTITRANLASGLIKLFSPPVHVKPVVA